MKRTYKKGNLTVFWDSDKCTHSGICDGWLPQVFDPNKRPWVNLDGADSETIRKVIDCCPSGALTYECTDKNEPGEVTIEVLENGPYRVRGKCKLIGTDKNVIKTRDAFILCRCGASGKMPICDGTHKRTGFQDKKAE